MRPYIPHHSHTDDSTPPSLGLADLERWKGSSCHRAASIESLDGIPVWHVYLFSFDREIHTRHAELGVAIAEALQKAEQFGM